MSKIFTVTLPDIGEGVVEGEVIEWLKQVGDPVRQDEPVVVVMTDKATVDLPAPYPGTLVRQYYQPGEMALLDKPLYDIEVAGEVPVIKEESKAECVQKVVKPVKETETLSPLVKETVTPIRRSSADQKVLATPATRKLAKEMGIDINQICGTGKEGRVIPADLQRLTTRKLPNIPRLPGDTEQPVIGIRGLMAKKTAESKQVIPHFSYFEQVDVTRLIQLKENVKKEAISEGIHVTFMPFFIRALSLTINRFPVINSSFDTTSHTLILHQQQNVGLAVNTRQGLIVPVLKNVQEMSLADIIRAFEKLKEKALGGKLQSSDMKEATITISNYGVLGNGLWATPVISYPEVAILAINKIQKQPTVKNNQIVVRDVTNLSWSFDHRVIDGDIAARVSRHFADLLRNPAGML